MGGWKDDAVIEGSLYMSRYGIYGGYPVYLIPEEFYPVGLPS